MSSSNAPASGPPAHLPLLDGLRGIAALSVVVGHSAIAGFLPDYFVGLGQLGVATFYALSGFLMAHLYLRRPLTRAEIRAYLVARGARILPLYWLVVGGASILLGVAGTSLYGMMDGRDVIANLALLRGDGVFWSIPVEVHFYLLFCLLWVAAAFGRFWTGLGLLLAAQVLAFLLLRDVLEGSRWIYYWLHIFLAGGAIAWGLRFSLTGSDPVARPFWAHLIGWAAVLLVILSPAGARQYWGLPQLPSSIDPLIGGLAVALLLCTALGLGPLRHIDRKIFTYLGNISFGIYLLHVPTIIVARELGPWIGSIPLAQFALVCASTLALAALSFHLWERPAARWLRSRYEQKQKSRSGPPLIRSQSPAIRRRWLARSR